jgi:hypothetical protein
MIRAVTALQYIADRKIEEAIARGELDNLPGAGKPIDLEDYDPLMPPEARMAWRILKNANLNPEDLLLREKEERRRAYVELLAS